MFNNSEGEPARNKELLRILVVEDEEEHVDLILGALEENETAYSIAVATTGKKCLELLKEDDFDVVLLDYQLPDLDGITILREAKRINPGTFFVIVTGAGSEQIAVEAMKLNAFDYVVKSGDYYNLIPRVLSNLPSHRPKILAQQVLATLFRIGITGADVVLSDEINFSDDQDRFLLKIGVFYMTLMGQGAEDNLGIFGPLPVAGYPEYRSLVYAFSIEVSDSIDPRRKGLEYCLLVFFIPQDLVRELPKPAIMRNALDELIGHLKGVLSLDEEFLKTAKGALQLSESS
ncbi:MAG: response regulator [Candidatus Heimdallarchaeota archaeon]